MVVTAPVPSFQINRICTLDVSTGKMNLNQTFIVKSTGAHTVLGSCELPFLVIREHWPQTGMLMGQKRIKKIVSSLVILILIPLIILPDGA